MKKQQFWKFIYELLVSGKYQLQAIDSHYAIALLTDKTKRQDYLFDASSIVKCNEDILAIYKQLSTSNNQGTYYFINNAGVATDEVDLEESSNIQIIYTSFDDLVKSFHVSARKQRIKENTDYLQKIIRPEFYDKINIMKYPLTYVTALLILLVFLIQCLVVFIYHQDWLVLLGASNYIAIAQYHEYYRTVTAILLHADIFHVLFNTFALISIGKFVEQMLNKIQWLVLFLTTGIFANIIAAYQSQEYIFIGASGAICGFIGATLYLSLVDNYLKKTKLYQEMLATMVGITIFGFALGHVSHIGHFVGFISGFILMAMLRFINKKAG